MNAVVIYRAQNTVVTLYRDVKNAIMVCKEISFLNDSDVHARRAWNEVQILSKMPHHDGIVQLRYWEMGINCARIHTVYCGSSLMDVLNNNFEVIDARKTMVQIVNGLLHIHSHGVAHRDVKLDNIVYMNGTVKLIDFGLAYQYDTDHISDVCHTGL